MYPFLNITLKDLCICEEVNVMHSVINFTLNNQG